MTGVLLNPHHSLPLMCSLTFLVTILLHVCISETEEADTVAGCHDGQTHVKRGDEARAVIDRNCITLKRPFRSVKGDLRTWVVCNLQDLVVQRVR